MTSDKTSEIIDAAANLAKAVPVYDDALKPIMLETGKALSTVGKTVNVALAPVRGMVWGAEKIEEWITTKVSEKLKDISPENITTPDLSIAGPTIESLKFNGHKAELSEMFAGLFASSMNKKTNKNAHPSFVGIIGDMSALDAQFFAVISENLVLPTINITKSTVGIEVVSHVACYYNEIFDKLATGLQFPAKGRLEVIQSSIENLDRLGLVNSYRREWLTDARHQKVYQALESGILAEEFRKRTVSDKYEYKIEKSYVGVTQTGKKFRDTVLVDLR